MFLLTKPGEADIRNFLSRQQREPLLYEHAGVMSDPPSGYTVDHNRIRLGIGPVVYQKAVEALRRWEMFNLGWLELCWPDAPIVTGTTVAVLAHVLGIWSLSDKLRRQVLNELLRLARDSGQGDSAPSESRRTGAVTRRRRRDSHP